jgi:propanediol utilization protein
MYTSRRIMVAGATGVAVKVTVTAPLSVESALGAMSVTDGEFLRVKPTMRESTDFPILSVMRAWMV